MDLTKLHRPGCHALVHSAVAAVSALTGFLSMNTSAAYVTDCVVNGPRYQLTSDLVNWSMKIGSGQSCIRGLRIDNVAMIESLQLVSPPQIGQVALKGPSFTYSAKSGYEGEDFSLSWYRAQSTGRVEVRLFASTFSLGTRQRRLTFVIAALGRSRRLNRRRSHRRQQPCRIMDHCHPVPHGTGQMARRLRCDHPSIGRSSIVLRRLSGHQVNLSDASARDEITLLLSRCVSL